MKSAAYYDAQRTVSRQVSAHLASERDEKLVENARFSP
jgi:hypothetical protein